MSRWDACLLACNREDYAAMCGLHCAELKLNILLREAGHTTDADRYAWLSAGCRREITSSKQLTKAEASRAIDALGRKATSRAVEPSASEADLLDTEGDDA